MKICGRTLMLMAVVLALGSSCSGRASLSSPADQSTAASTTAHTSVSPSTTRAAPSSTTASTVFEEQTTTTLASGQLLWTVSSVIDGDTITVVRGPVEERLRLIGMNANEDGECMADEATQALKEMVLGREVSLVADQSDRDRYGRLLRYVWAGDLFVNAVMVEEGFAIAREYLPDTAMSGTLAAAETSARDARIGLWAPDACGATTAAEVQIVHVEFDAPGNDNENPNGEWVEIENRGADLVDLSGWLVKDESASHRYPFPIGFNLDPRARVRIFTGCGTSSSDELYWCEQGSAVWNNSGDTAFLLDPSGNIVHSWTY